jgi:hypothetical protein
MPMPASPKCLRMLAMYKILSPRLCSSQLTHMPVAVCRLV